MVAAGEREVKVVAARAAAARAAAARAAEVMDSAYVAYTAMLSLAVIDD